eukprot:scaffold16261_cov151-Isochrysis_galbana.AAC.2
MRKLHLGTLGLRRTENENAIAYLEDGGRVIFVGAIGPPLMFAVIELELRRSPASGGGGGAKLMLVGSLSPLGLRRWCPVGGKNIILRVEERVDLAGYIVVACMGSCSGLDQAWRAGREQACARLSFRGRRVIARASWSSQQAQLQGVRMDRKLGAQSVEGCRWWLVI